MGGHCAAPRARRREGGGWARSAAQSPITKKPANTRPNGTMQAAARKHAVDMGHLGPKKRRGQGQDPGHTGGRLLPANAAPPPVNGATGRDASGAVLIVLHATSRGRAGARHGGHHECGSTVSHRAPPRQEPRTAPPGTSPSGRS